MKNLLRTTPGTGIAAFEKWGDEDVQLNQKYVGYLMIRNDYIGNSSKSELFKPDPKSLLFGVSDLCLILSGTCRQKMQFMKLCVVGL